MTGEEATIQATGLGSSSAMALEVTNVTGTRSFVAEDINPADPAGAVAQALSAELSLPQNVCWVLRDDSSSAFLVSEQPIGQQVQPGAKVTLTPRAHLG